MELLVVVLFFTLAVPLGYAWDSIRDLREEVEKLKMQNDSLTVSQDAKREANTSGGIGSP